jgi:hypothetical protein
MKMEQVYPVNPFYAPEHPPLERLRCRVDYDIHLDQFEIARDEWRGRDHWWQLAPGDAERYGLSVQDLPRLYAIFNIFDALLGLNDHYISGDAELIQGALKAMPWLNPNVYTDDDFGRFAELMGADRQKARGFMLKFARFGEEYMDDEARAARHRDDPDIPF